MAGRIQSLWLVGIAEDTSGHRSSSLLWREDPSQNCNSKVGPRYQDLTPVGEEPRLALSTSTPVGMLLEENNESTSAILAIPQSPAAERNNKVVHDEGAVFVALLRDCTKNKDLYRGTCIHDDILKQGLLHKCSDALVTMYAKCGALEKAQALLDMHKSRNVVSWTALIAGYAQKRQSHIALNCFECMQREGVHPNAVTYACALKACGTIGAVDKGKQIHDEITRQGLLRDNIVLGTAVMDMYAKCGAMAKAERMLEELPSRDVVSWSALITGYAQQGQGKQALYCFDRMQREGIPPDAVTYVGILKACGTIGAADKGKQIHDEIVRQGLLRDSIKLGTALLDMYARFGALAKAECVLQDLPSRNVVSWNALITGYAQHGQGKQALNCFERMQHDGIPPDVVTYTCILKACGTIGASEMGEQIHDKIVRQGLLQDDIVLGNALVDMYAKCGALEKAQCVLEELPSRDIVSWNALIAGYAKEGPVEQALNCFECMKHEGICPDAMTYAAVLKACGTLGAADKGEQIHEKIDKQGLLQNDMVLGSALVDMYVKCGALAKAQCVLEGLPSRDVVSWSALIAGYAQQGHGEQALACFEGMQHEGISPDATAFCCVLNVCSHLGLVEEGHMHFENMSTKYGVKPDIESYTCMIDLFGRAGHLEKAVRLIQEMPSSDYSIIWHTLLGACQKWGDANVGRWAFDQAVQVDKRDGASYVLMSNIYAAAGMHENAKSIEAMRLKNKAWKKPAYNQGMI